MILCDWCDQAKECAVPRGRGSLAASTSAERMTRGSACCSWSPPAVHLREPRPHPGVAVRRDAPPAERSGSDSAAELSGASPFPLALGGEARATQRSLPVV